MKQLVRILTLMIIDGKAIAQEIQEELAQYLSSLPGRPPCLAVVLVGDDPASHVYVRNKKRACERAGMASRSYEIPATADERELLALVADLNQDPEVDGILVQLPLSPGMDAKKVLEAIDPAKDVDGFHPINQGKLLSGDDSGFVPCTPLGIKVLLQRAGITLAGRHVVIVGRSNIVGKPLAALLVQKTEGANATVTIAHSASLHLDEICRLADVLVAAVGVPEMITARMVKEDAVVVDVGINRVPLLDAPNGYRLVGDVAYEQVKERVSAITPVPGGVGPMTIAMLLRNTLMGYLRREMPAVNPFSAVGDIAGINL